MKFMRLGHREHRAIVAMCGISPLRIAGSTCLSEALGASQLVAVKTLGAGFGIDL